MILGMLFITAITTGVVSGAIVWARKLATGIPSMQDTMPCTTGEPFYIVFAKQQKD